MHPFKSTIHTLQIFQYAFTCRLYGPLTLSETQSNPRGSLNVPHCCFPQFSPVLWVNFVLVPMPYEFIPNIHVISTSEQLTHSPVQGLPNSRAQ